MKQDYYIIWIPSLNVENELKVSQELFQVLRLRKSGFEYLAFS